MTSDLDRERALRARGRALRVAMFRRAKRRDWAPALLLAGPCFLGVVILYLYPVVLNFIYSFTTWGTFGGFAWSGLDNFTKLLNDPDFYRSLLNTVVYVAVLLCGIPVATVFAALLDRRNLRFAPVYRVAFFVPYIAMPAAISTVWRLIFNGDFGLLNYLLSLIGVKGPSWLSTEWFALLAVSVVGVWMSVGFNMIVLSAGMSTIPREQYEAAAIDGAGPFRRFYSITVPLLSPTLFFVTVITTISGFQLFDLLFALMGVQNPVINKTASLVYLFYSHQQQGDNGYAAAVSVAILVIVGLLTAVQFVLQRRWVHF